MFEHIRCRRRCGMIALDRRDRSDRARLHDGMGRNRSSDLLMGETYDQKRPGKKLLLQSAFLWFYFSINVGALLSQLAMPYLRDHYGYAIAFQFPAWLMLARSSWTAWSAGSWSRAIAAKFVMSISWLLKS